MRHLLHLAEEVVTVCVVPYLVVGVPLQDSHISADILAKPRAEARHVVVAREALGISGHSLGGRHPNAEQIARAQRARLSVFGRFLSYRFHRVFCGLVAHLRR